MLYFYVFRQLYLTNGVNLPHIYADFKDVRGSRLQIVTFRVNIS